MIPNQIQFSDINEKNLLEIFPNGEMNSNKMEFIYAPYKSNYFEYYAIWKLSDNTYEIWEVSDSNEESEVIFCGVWKDCENWIKYIKCQ